MFTVVVIFQDIQGRFPFGAFSTHLLAEAAILELVKRQNVLSAAIIPDVLDVMGQ
jgi:hypothetical protein